MKVVPRNLEEAIGNGVEAFCTKGEGYVPTAEGTILVYVEQFLSQRFCACLLQMEVKERRREVVHAQKIVRELWDCITEKKAA